MEVLRLQFRNKRLGKLNLFATKAFRDTAAEVTNRLPMLMKNCGDFEQPPLKP